MRYRHIAVIGVTVIATVLLISGLLYFINKGIGGSTCPTGSFFCANSTECIPQRYICHKDYQCPGDENNCDDYFGHWGLLMLFERNFTEHICDFSNPPDNCKYQGCSVTCEELNGMPQNLSAHIVQMVIGSSSISELKVEDFKKYPDLNNLNVSYNGIKKLEPGVFSNLTNLEILMLSGNKISEINPGHLTGLNKVTLIYLDENKLTFADLIDLEGSDSLKFIDFGQNSLTSNTLKLPHLPALDEIYLNNNIFDSINNTLFIGCPRLKSLNLEKNRIEIIDENTFEHLTGLTELNLASNQIISIPQDTFKSLGSLTKLELGYNPLKHIHLSFFTSLPNLQSLNFENLEVTETLQKNDFDKFKQLKFIYFSKFHYCATYAPNVKNCIPASDGVSSLSHLLDKFMLRAAVWVIAILTCLGNILVLWGRFTGKDENRVLSIVIRNLAVSDILMGIYLLGIAVQDIRYRDNYNKTATSWMSSLYCISLGVLGMTSSEVSMLILSFMSVERFFIIVPPLGHRETSRAFAILAMCIFWIIGITIAIGPAIYWQNSTKFYGVNGMCFPLHIDDPYLIGWEYSAFVFIGLNLLGLITIGAAYAGIFASIWKTQRATPLPVSDSEFALRLFFIVLTNALCWAPIIALKIQAMTNHPVPPDLHGWIVTFILPINSAVNPLLYTFTTTKFRERLSGGWVGKMRNYFAGSLSRQDSQISTATVKKNSFKMNYQTQVLMDVHSKQP